MFDLGIPAPNKLLNKTVGSNGRDGKVFGISGLIGVYLPPVTYITKQWAALVGMAKCLVSHV